MAKYEIPSELLARIIRQLPAELGDELTRCENSFPEKRTSPRSSRRGAGQAIDNIINRYKMGIAQAKKILRETGEMTLGDWYSKLYALGEKPFAQSDLDKAFCIQMLARLVGFHKLGKLDPYGPPATATEETKVYTKQAWSNRFKVVPMPKPKEKPVEAREDVEKPSKEAEEA